MEVRSDAEIEAAIGSLKDQHAGLVLTSDSFLGVHQTTWTCFTAPLDM
jgi:hypothetical protein